MNDIKIIKAGEKIRIKSCCTKFGGKYNGEIGIIKKNYWQTDGIYGDVYISLENQYDENSEYGYFYFHVGDFDVITDTGTIIENTIRTKGEEKMRSEKIINLWRNNRKNAILDNIVQKRNEILNVDPLYSRIKKYADEINKILMEQGFGKVSDETLLKGHVVNTTNTLLSQNKALEFTLQKALDEQCNEICAMLSACDTYEQEMEVLKTYNIIGEDGKLVVVCNEE